MTLRPKSCMQRTQGTGPAATVEAIAAAVCLSCTPIQGHSDTGAHRYRGTPIQGHTNKGAHQYRGTPIQGHSVAGRSSFAVPIKARNDPRSAQRSALERRDLCAKRRPKPASCRGADFLAAHRSRRRAPRRVNLRLGTFAFWANGGILTVVSAKEMQHGCRRSQNFRGCGPHGQHE
jgi:hypothetical protein